MIGILIFQVSLFHIVRANCISFFPGFKDQKMAFHYRLHFLKTRKLLQRGFYCAPLKLPFMRDVHHDSL